METQFAAVLAGDVAPELNGYRIDLLETGSPATMVLGSAESFGYTLKRLPGECPKTRVAQKRWFYVRDGLPPDQLEPLRKEYWPNASVANE